MHDPTTAVVAMTWEKPKLLFREREREREREKEIRLERSESIYSNNRTIRYTVQRIYSGRRLVFIITIIICRRYIYIYIYVPFLGYFRQELSRGPLQRKVIPIAALSAFSTMDQSVISGVGIIVDFLQRIKGSNVTIG